MGQSLQVSDRSRVRRGSRLAHHDRADINAILDEALVVQVGFVVEGQPFVIPMGFGREDNVLYLHGANASRMIKNLAQGIDICVSTTLLDGIVIARSLFHHAMNYRSVVLFGRATLVQDEADKIHALKVLSEHITPGQWDYARTPSRQEVKGTTVLAFPIEDGSAKIRSGGPNDDAKDYALPVWAGQLPLKLTTGEPIPDAQLAVNIALPDHLTPAIR